MAIATFCSILSNWTETASIDISESTLDPSYPENIPSEWANEIFWY